jgi:hypothetical protein
VTELRRHSNFRFGFFCHAERSKSICILSKKQLLLSIFAHSDAFAALSMTKKASRFSKAETAETRNNEYRSR